MIELVERIFEDITAHHEPVVVFNRTAQQLLDSLQFEVKAAVSQLTI